jgi:hypothetical protein
MTSLQEKPKYFYIGSDLPFVGQNKFFFERIWLVYHQEGLAPEEFVGVILTQVAREIVSTTYQAHPVDITNEEVIKTAQSMKKQFQWGYSPTQSRYTITLSL